MKIAYVTSYDLKNRNSWTKHVQGICTAGYYIANNLVDDSTSIEYIGPLSKKFAIPTRLKWSFYRNLAKKDYYRWAEPFIVKNYAHQIQNKLKNLDPDVILSPESTVPIAYLNAKHKRIDPYMSNLCQENIKNIYKIEAEALKRCDLIIYTSEWAARMASETYGIKTSKIKVVPWGANFESTRSLEDIKRIVDSRITRPCKLLFIGVDWERKGGDLALQVATKLNQVG